MCRDTTITDVTNSESPSYQSIHIQLLYCGWVVPTEPIKEPLPHTSCIYLQPQRLLKVWIHISRFVSSRFWESTKIKDGNQPEVAEVMACSGEARTWYHLIVDLSPPSKGKSSQARISICPGKGNHVHRLFHVYTCACLTNCTSFRNYTMRNADVHTWRS